MKEEKEYIIELEKLLDYQITTVIWNISNYIGNNDDIDLSGGSLMQSYLIMPDQTLSGQYIYAPVIGPNTDYNIIKPLRFNVMTSFWDHIGNIWLFQDARTPDGIIKYFVGDNPNYKASREVMGNSKGGGYKSLKVICTVPGDLNTVQMRLY
ncbi:hypothetical protein [Photorhabdus namnaonensis]|uniref:Uncharacterized protein n=1 Tax=Photorhabdus namnaonensis TaxID=1851568 RepID=A0A1B8YMG6_9GAMM|nr:hypothetical protein [Photorhabdus namnaonensis]OCA56303.1 hypothetical protein Phpb_00802 [Photorhabdus namnaonensis]